MSDRPNIRLPILLVTGALIVAGLIAGLGSGTATAEKKRIVPTPNRGAEETRAARRLANAFAANGRWVQRATFSTLPPFSDPAAISTKRLAGFPRHGDSFAILANGDVKLADDKSTSESTSSQLGGPTIRGARDVVIHRTLLRVPKDANCLSIRFRFLTEEFPEFVNDIYNDAFIAELDVSNWDTSGKGDPRLNAPGNFAFDAKGNPITVNAVGDASVTRRRARGTTYDGATRILRASTRVTAGQHILYLSIFDQGDRDYDSAVFLDRLTINSREPCKSGAVRD